MNFIDNSVINIRQTTFQQIKKYTVFENQVITKTINNVDCMFQPSNHGHGDVKVHGIIGYELLKETIVAVNIDTGEVYLK